MSRPCRDDEKGAAPVPDMRTGLEHLKSGLARTAPEDRIDVLTTQNGSDMATGDIVSRILDLSYRVSVYCPPMKPFVRFSPPQGKQPFCARRFWDFDDLIQKRLLSLLRQVADPDEISKACVGQWKRNMEPMRRFVGERLEKEGQDVAEPECSVRRTHMLLEHVGTGGLVLYIGCGTGRESIAWAREGLRVVGIDTDTLLLDIAGRLAKRFRYPAFFAGMDMAKLGLRTGTFDGFLLEIYGSLPSVKQSLTLQRELGRIMKKGGTGLVVANRKKYCSYWFLMRSRWPVPMAQWLAGQARLDFFFGEKDACEDRLQYGLFTRCHTVESLSAELARTFDVVSCRYEDDPRYVLAVVKKKEGASEKTEEAHPPAGVPRVDLARLEGLLVEVETVCAELQRHAEQVAAFFMRGGTGAECLMTFSSGIPGFIRCLERVLPEEGGDRRDGPESSMMGSCIASAAELP